MPRRTGICVGQNNYSPASGVTPLKGCINDALLIGELLKTAGYDVTQLHDEAATQEAILSSLEKEVARLRAGDVFVFWNSSHGYQVQDTDPSGDELDFKDEAICCYDNDIRDPLTDDKFARILREAHPEAIVLMHSDSCHSATLTRGLMRAMSGLPVADDVRSLAAMGAGAGPSLRGLAADDPDVTRMTSRSTSQRRGGAAVELALAPSEPIARARDDTPLPRLFIPPRVDGLFALGANVVDLDDYVGREVVDLGLYGVEKPLRRFGALSRSIDESEMTHLLLSGCQPQQVSWDAPFPPGRHGAMTYYFAVVVLEAWRKRGEPITYSQAHAAACQRLKQQFPQQDPQLEGPPHLKDLPVFGYDPSGSSRSVYLPSLKETMMSNHSTVGTKPIGSTSRPATRETSPAGRTPSTRSDGPGSTNYVDGTLLRGRDNELFVYVGGELIAFEDVPRAPSPLDLVEIVGFVPPELSDDELDALPRGETPRGVVEDISPEVELTSSMPRRYMQTQARLSQDSGRIDATTRTWTRQPFVGFTGGVIILFAGPNGETIGSTGLHQFGVDGFRIPFKNWNRQDNWSEDVDRVLASRVTSLTFCHTHAPKSRLDAIVREAEAIGKAVAEVAALIVAIL